MRCHLFLLYFLQPFWVDTGSVQSCQNEVDLRENNEVEDNWIYVKLYPSDSETNLFNLQIEINWIIIAQTELIKYIYFHIWIVRFAPFFVELLLEDADILEIAGFI